MNGAFNVIAVRNLFKCENFGEGLVKNLSHVKKMSHTKNLNFFSMIETAARPKYWLKPKKVFPSCDEIIELDMVECSFDYLTFSFVTEKNKKKDRSMNRVTFVD